VREEGGYESPERRRIRHQEDVLDAFEKAVTEGAPGLNDRPSANGQTTSVRVSELRKRVPELSDEEFVDAIKRLQMGDGVRLHMDENQQSVTPEQRKWRIRSRLGDGDTLLVERERRNQHATRNIEMPQLTPEEGKAIAGLALKGQLGARPGGWVSADEVGPAARPHLESLARKGFIQREGNNYRVDPRSAGQKKADADAEARRPAGSPDVLEGEVIPQPLQAEGREPLHRLKRGAVIEGYTDPKKPGTFTNVPETGANQGRVKPLQIVRVEVVDDDGNVLKGNKALLSGNRRITARDDDGNEFIADKVSNGSSWRWLANPDEESPGDIEGEFRETVDAPAVNTPSAPEAPAAPKASSAPTSAGGHRTEGRTNIARAQAGEMFLAEQNADGEWRPSNRLTTSTPLEFVRRKPIQIKGYKASRYQIIARDPDGNEVTLNGHYPGIQTIRLAPERTLGGKKLNTPRKAAKAPEPEAPSAPASGVDESVSLSGDPEGDNMRMHGDSATMRLAQAYAKAGRNGSANRMMDLRRRATAKGGDTTPQQVVDELKAMADAESDPNFKRQLQRALDDIDAPMTPMPELPANTPPLARQLMEDLHAIPRARKGRRGGGQSLVDQLAEVYRNAAAGKRGDDGRSAADRIRNIVREQVHESEEASFRLWELNDRVMPEGGKAKPLVDELRKWERGLLTGTSPAAPAPTLAEGPSDAEIMRMNIADLRQLAKNRGIADWETLGKDALLDALLPE
jgi:hypothetical protein